MIEKKINCIYPFTLPQQDVYFEQLLYPLSSIYNIGAKIEIEGEIDIFTFKRAYKHLISQNDAYKMVIVGHGEESGFSIIDQPNSNLNFLDFSNFKGADQKALNFMQSEFVKSFDFSKQEPLHRFILIKISNHFHYLFTVSHHIITDGWGTSLMFHRFAQNYNELLEHGTIISEYSFSYLDFWKEDLTYQKSAEFQIDKGFWLSKFNSLPESLIPKCSEKKNKSKRHVLIIQRPLYNKLIALSKDLNVTVFHIFLGILYTYFGRCYNNSDFGIGIPVLNRGKASFKKTVGLFMGLSPLRIQLDFDNSFKDLCTQIKKEVKCNYRYQRFPLGKLIQELKIYQEKEKIFNITLSYEKQNYSNYFLNTITKVIPFTHEAERVALAIYIREFDDQDDVKLDFDYNLSYFNKITIGRTVDQFKILLDEVLNDPLKKLKDLELIPKQEKKQILIKFNDTFHPYPKTKTVLDLFSEQVKHFPKKIAVTDTKKSLSYEELEKKSSQIANYLLSTFGTREQRPIGILMNRSSKLLLAIMGILKSGRPYIPLDSTLPLSRLRYIINHSRSSVIIGDLSLPLEIKKSKITTIYLDKILDSSVSGEKPKNIQINSENSAYIIYTSGSTGNPKGVEIGHRSLVNFLLSMRRKPGILVNDKLYAVTTYSFDISILELFLPIITGATVIIPENEILKDPRKVIKHLNKYLPNIIQATPSFYQMLFNVGWKGNKNLKVLCGGDLLSESLVEKLIMFCGEVWNMYGPTEATIWSSIKRMESTNQSKNIGRPIDNTSFYILDQWFNPVAIGVQGEIYIGGAGMAKGYYLDEPMTRRKFAPSPFVENELLYRTGDQGCWNSTGEIEFKGRNDYQVKIRGYRVELREIEAKLVSVCYFTEAVVVPRKSEYNDGYLVGFVKSKSKSIHQNEIKVNLKQFLPEYMIPAVIIPLLEFPVTPNGKVNRKKLMEVDISEFSTLDEEHEYEEFYSFDKIKMKELWEKTLNIKVKNSNSNFFSLGGHSLKVAQLIGLISDEFHVKLNMKDIFDYPTIDAQVKLIQTSNEGKIQPIPKTVKKDYFPLASTQLGLWLNCQRDELSKAYNMYVAYEIHGDLAYEVMENSLRYLIIRHEILRTNFIEEGDGPNQIIRDTDNLHFQIDQIEFKDENQRDYFIIERVSMALDLQREPLFKVFFLKVNNNKFPLLLIVTHHLIIDGFSIKIIIQELGLIYSAFRNKRPPKIIKPRIQYKDYAVWAREGSSNLGNSKLLYYWKDQFKGFKPKNTFRRDSLKKTFKGSKNTFTINGDTLTSLMNLETSLAITPFSILLTSIQVLIYDITGNRDFCLGIPVGTRNHPDLQHLVGMFVNTIPIRSQFNGEETFKTRCLETKNKLKSAFSNQIPLDLLVKYLNFPQDLFDVLIVYQDYENNYDTVQNLEGILMKSYDIDYHASRFPVVFNFQEKEDMILCDVEYDIGLFEEQTILAIIKHYKNLLKAVLNNYIHPLDTVSLGMGVGDSDKQKDITIEFNFD